MKQRNSTELKRKMEGRWLRALGSLAPALTEAINKVGSNVPCPVSGGIDGFRLFPDANITGGGVKQSYRIFPEGIDMLMWVNNWSFTEVYDELEAWLGDKPISIGPVYTPKEKSAVDEESLRKWLNQMWLEALPLDDLKAYPARAYFARRRVKTAALAASEIRFHPCLKYKDKHGSTLGVYGAVLCLVRNNDGEPVSIHRTFITKCGLKIDLGHPNKAKKLTPSVKQRSRGRHIQLFKPMNGYLGLSEGLETALAVFEAKEFPVWPGISNTTLQGFVPPKGVHTIVNFVDKDRSKAGEISADILRSNLEPRGIRVIDLLPPTPVLDEDEKGVDWADQLIRDPSGFDLLDQILDFAQRKQA
jgi:putative DNA primase/helicase